jgi:hypothetical protein
VELNVLEVLHFTNLRPLKFHQVESFEMGEQRRRMTHTERWGLLFLVIVICAILLCCYIYGSPWM